MREIQANQITETIARLGLALATRHRYNRPEGLCPPQAHDNTRVSKNPDSWNRQ